MAMRPRGGGPNRPNRPPRPAARPVYEDFRPVSERHQEEEAEKLLIFLPGFKKESIRVSTEGKNTVRVRGERFIGGNKWQRFQEDFQAPDDCNMRGIHAKFENGLLIITMPWKVPKQLLDEHTKQTPLKTQPPSHKDDNAPPETSHPTVETPRKPAPLDPKAQLHSNGVKEKQRDDKKILDGESSRTQKGDDVPPKTIYPTIEVPRKLTPLKPTAQLPKPQNADKDQDSRVKEKQRDEKKILDDPLRSAESSKTQKGDEDRDFPPLRQTPLGKTSDEKEKKKDEKKILEGIDPKIRKIKEDILDQNRIQLIKSGKEAEKGSHDAGGKKIAEKSNDLREEFQEKVGQVGSKEKESTSKVAAGTSSYPGSEFGIGNLKKSLVELNEERQLLVNAGAAVLVIIALGAYVYHSIGLGKAE
ncbi:protein RESTRICTED TEV MOVEMENT 2 [Capsicum chacoense]